MTTGPPSFDPPLGGEGKTSEMAFEWGEQGGSKCHEDTSWTTGDWGAGGVSQEDAAKASSQPIGDLVFDDSDDDDFGDFGVADSEVTAVPETPAVPPEVVRDQHFSQVRNVFIALQAYRMILEN